MLSFKRIGGPTARPLGKRWRLRLAADPQRIIWDTDIDSDVDDVVATALLAGLELRGEATIIAATTATSDTYAPHTLRILLDHLRKGIPIGSFQGATLDASSAYTSAVSGTALPRIARSAYPEAVPILRQALFDAPSGSVKIAVGGTATNIAALLQSPGDGISALTGIQLVADRVASIHMMGGNFTSTVATESNITKDVAAAQYLATNTPVPVYWDGFEIANAALTRITNAVSYWEYDPYAVAWIAYNVVERPSWDLAAVQDAVRGTTDGHWTYSTPVDITFGGTGTTTHAPNASSKNRYLIRTDATAAGDLAIAATFQSLADEYMAVKGLLTQPSNLPLTAEYTFQEGSGQIVNNSLDSLDGTLGWDATVVGGEPTWTANGISMVGTQGVRIPAAAALDDDRFALVAIVRPSTITGNLQIATRDNSGQSNRNWQLRSSSGALQLVLRGGGVITPITGAGTLPANTWVMVTLWCNRFDYYARINGTNMLTGTTGTSVQLAGGQDLIIGAIGSGTAFNTESFKGDIRYVSYGVDKRLSDIVAMEQTARDFATSQGITLP